MTTLMRLSKSTFGVILAVILLGSVFTGVTAAQQSNEWCLNVGSQIGVEADLGGCEDPVISNHDNVSITYDRTTPSTNNDVYILPTIVSNTRQSGTVELVLRHTPTGETVDQKEVQLDGASGQEVNTTSLLHERLSGGEIPKKEYRVEVTLKNADGDVVVQDSAEFGGFYMADVEETTGGDETDDTGDNQYTFGSGNATVVPEDVGVQVTEVISDVSRYNDQTSEVSPLQDTSIPPLVKNNTSTYSTGVGVFENFSNMRQREDPTRNDATVRSVDVGGNQLINVGTVTYGIPQAKDHRLVLTYSMQVANPAGDQKIVGVEFVDSNGNVIDQDKNLSDLGADSPRWLDDTVKDSVNTTQLEQLENADEDILNEESITINLTQEEIDYINNNYQAYIVYRTAESGSPGGLTVFKPFRSAIYSTDATNLEFSYKPEQPVANESVQFNVEDLPPSFCECSGGTQEAGEIVWDIDGTEVTQNVSVSEYEQLRDNPESTLTGPSESFGIGGTKTVTMTVRTPNNIELQRTRTISVFGENENIEDTPATFDVSYKPLNEINPKYGSIDVPPTKGIDSLDARARVEVTIKNTGNSQIQRRVALLDTMLGEFGYQDQVRDKQTVSVSPESTETVRLGTDWAPDEYGRHEITVVEYKDGSPVNIPNANTGDDKTSVYVQQPATLKIRQVVAPEAHLVYDNFTGTAKVENVGDLSTKHPSSHVRFEGEFTDTWSSVKIGPEELPDIAGGNVRDGTPGETKRISFERDYDYTPNYPEFLNPESTGQDRDANDSPWTDTTTSESGSEFDLIFRTRHMFAEENQARFQLLNDSATKPIRIYRMQIINITESGNLQSYTTDAEAPTFSASGYKFTEDHYTSRGELSVSQNFDNDQTEWPNWNPSAIPTTSSITDVQQMTTDTTNGVRYMDMRVALTNPGTAPTGTARVKVTSDRKVYYPSNWEQPHTVDDRNEYVWINQNAYSDKVVGVAGIDLAQWEKRTGGQYQPRVKVPIVIPNHPENEGVHTLTVKVRHKPDFIKQYDEAVSYQFEYKIDVKVWGDSMYIGYENQSQGDQYEQEVFQNCQNFYADGNGECLTSGETNTNFDFVYRNVGGAPVTQTIDAHFYQIDPSNVVNDTSDLNDHFTQNADQRHLRNNLLTSDGTYDTDYHEQQYFWEQNITQTLPPAGEGDPYQIWTFNHDFYEPGLYEISTYQWRVTEDANRYSNHHLEEIDRNQNFGPQSTQMQGQNEATVMVWDDKRPISRFHPQDCTQQNGGTSSSGVNYNQCLEQEYNGLDSFNSGSSLLWEDGALRIDGEQRERWVANEASNKDVSSDNVGVDHYTFKLYEGQSASGTPIAFNRFGDSNSPAFIHRFEDPGYYTVELVVNDHDAYVDGQGSDHQDVHTETFHVENDTSEPYVNVDDLECGGGTDTELHNYDAEDMCWNDGGTHVWSSGTHTDGAHISWGSYTNDNGVGIESIQWSTNYSANSDFDTQGNFDGPTSHSSFSDNVGQTETGNNYATDQKNFDSRGGGDTYAPVTVELETTDFANNVDSDSTSITVVTDNTPASTTCMDGNSDCYDEDVDVDGSGTEHTNSASAKACVKFSEQGPNGGIGFDTGTLDADGGNVVQKTESTIEVCVSADSNPSASASCSVSCDCGETDDCDVDDYDTDPDSDSATVSVDDYHGNTVSKSISVYTNASAYDEDSDECDGGECPEEDSGTDSGTE